MPHEGDSPLDMGHAPLKDFAAASGGKVRGHRRFALCCTFRRFGLAAYSAQPLAGILPSGARTFLPTPGLPPDIQRLPGRLSGADYTLRLAIALDGPAVNPLP